MLFSNKFFLKLKTVKFVLLMIFVLFQLQANAQHCPFDGGHLVAVHLTDANGKAVTNISKNLTLVEINNPVAQSCSYAEGLLAKKFLPTKQELNTHYERFWDHWIKPNYQDWILLNGGYYAVILNQAEESCMIKKGSDFDYRAREFEIKLDGFSDPPPVKVQKEDIFDLCTNGGSWTRIKPVEITVKTR
jgi:hypothetical protein